MLRQLDPEYTGDAPPLPAVPVPPPTVLDELGGSGVGGAAESRLLLGGNGGGVPQDTGGWGVSGGAAGSGGSGGGAGGEGAGAARHSNLNATALSECTSGLAGGCGAGERLGDTAGILGSSCGLGLGGSRSGGSGGTSLHVDVDVNVDEDNDVKVDVEDDEACGDDARLGGVGAGAARGSSGGAGSARRAAPLARCSTDLE